MKKSIRFFTAAITLFLSVGALADKDLDLLLQQFKKYQAEPTQKKEGAGSAREQINSYVHENYTRIYLVLMKNSDSSQGPVLWGGNLELRAIASKYKICINVKVIGENGTYTTSIGDIKNRAITIQLKDGHYSYFDSSEQLMNVPSDGNCMFNAVLAAAKANGLTQMPQTVAELRSEVVEWLQENSDTSQNLQIQSLDDPILDGVHTLVQIMNDFIIINTFEADSKYIELYQKYTEKGYVVAQRKLGVCYELGIGTEENTTKAFELYNESAEKGDAGAQFNLACCYKDGIGTEQNTTKAFELYKELAEKGDAGAQCCLGNCYENGMGIKKNTTKAFELYKELAEKGDATAQCFLGRCYECGIGTEQNTTKAFELYNESAEKGDAIAQYCLGNCYENGIGIEKNTTKAFELYQKAANQGDMLAQFNLGYSYEHGIGTVKCLAMAIMYYQLAAQQGLLDAKIALKKILASSKTNKNKFVFRL